MEQEPVTKKSQSVGPREPKEKSIQAKANNQVVAQHLRLVDANIGQNPALLMMKTAASGLKGSHAGNGIQTGPSNLGVGNLSLGVPMTPLIESIRKQMEFYFGDPNLSRDRYLQNLIAKNHKGYVEIKVMMAFKKIQQFLSTGNIQSFEDRMATLRSAIKSSPLLKMCKRGLLVKRAVPFQLETLNDPVNQQEVDLRLVYVENLPSNCTQEALVEIFKAYGTIIYVSLPKTSSKSDSGSSTKTAKCRGYAFVEFATPEAATAALAVNNSIPERFIHSAGNEPLQPLSVISKAKWNEWKQKLKPLSKRPPAGNTMDVEEENGISSSSGFKNGTLWRVRNVPPQGLTKKDFKVMLQAHTDKLKYIDYQPGRSEAFIRFETPDACITLKDKFKSLLGVKESQLPIESVSGEEEVEYFKKVEKKREHFRTQKQAQQSKSVPITPKSSSAQKPIKKSAAKKQTKQTN